MRPSICILACMLTLLLAPVVAQGSVNEVFLTTTVNYPDSVVAAAAANKIGAPVIVTEEGRLTDGVIETLKELDPRTVYIIGGPAVISEDVESQLTELNITSERIWDMTRFGTAAGIGMYFWIATGAENAVLVCDDIHSIGEEYKQLAASLSLARLYNAPILLTECDALSLYSASAITALNVSSVVLVGTNPSENLTSSVEALGTQLVKVTGTSIDKTLDRIVGHIKTRLTELEGIDTVRIVVTEDRFEDILKMPNDAGDTIVFVISDTGKAKELVDFVRNYNITNIIVVGDPELSMGLIDRFKEQNVTEDSILAVTEEDPVAAAAELARNAKEKYAERTEELSSKITELEQQLQALQLAKKALDEVGRAEVVVGEMHVLVSNYKDDITVDEAVLEKAVAFIEKGEAALAKARDALDAERYVEAFRQARLSQDLASQGEWAVISSLDQERRIERIEELVGSEKNDVRNELDGMQDLILGLEERIESFEEENGEDKKLRYLLKAVLRLGRDAEFYALDANDIDAFKHAAAEIKRKAGEVDKLISRSQLGLEDEGVSDEVEDHQFESALNALQYEFEFASEEDVELGDLHDLLNSLKQAGSGEDGWDQVLYIRERLDRKKDSGRHKAELDDGERYVEELAAKVEALKSAGYDLSVEESIIEELRTLIEEGKKLMEQQGMSEEVDHLTDQAKALVSRLETSIGIMQLDFDIAAFDTTLDELDGGGTDVGRFRIEMSRFREEFKDIKDELSEASASGDIGYLFDLQNRFDGFDRQVRKFMGRTSDHAGTEREDFQFEDELENAYGQLEDARERLSEMEAMGVDLEEVYYLMSLAEEKLYEAYSEAAENDMDNAWKQLGKAWDVIEEVHVRGHLEGVTRHYEEVVWQMEEMVSNGIDVGPALDMFNEIEDMVVSASNEIQAGKYKSATGLLGKIEKRFGSLHRALDEGNMHSDFIREQERVRQELDEMRFRAQELPFELAEQLNDLLDEIEQGVENAIEKAMNGKARAAEKHFRAAMEKMPLAHFFRERAMVEEGLARMYEELENMAYEGFDTSEMEGNLGDVARCFSNAMDKMRDVRGPQQFDRVMGKCHHRMERLHEEFEMFMKWRHFSDQIEEANRFLEDMERRMEDAGYDGFKVPGFIKELQYEYTEAVEEIQALAKKGEFRRAERMFEKLWRIREQIEMSGAFIDVERRLGELEQRFEEAEYDQGIDSTPYRRAVEDMRQELDQMRRSKSNGHKLGRAIDKFHRKIDQIEREFESGRWLGGLKERLDRMEEELRNDEYNGIRVDDLYEELSELRGELRGVVRELQEMEGGRWDRIIQKFEQKIGALEQRRAMATIPRQLEQRLDDMSRRIEDLEYEGIDVREAQNGMREFKRELDGFKDNLRNVKRPDQVHREQEKFNRRIDEFENKVFRQLENMRMFADLERRFEDIAGNIERMEYNDVDVGSLNSQFSELERKAESLKKEVATARDPGRVMESFWRELDQFQQGLWIYERLQGMNNEVLNFEDEVERMEDDGMADAGDLRVLLDKMHKNVEAIEQEVKGARDPGRAMEKFDREWEALRQEFWRLQWFAWKGNELDNMDREVDSHDSSIFEEIEQLLEDGHRKAQDANPREWERMQQDLDRRFNELSERFWQSGGQGDSAEYDNEPYDGRDESDDRGGNNEACESCFQMCTQQMHRSTTQCKEFCQMDCMGAASDAGHDDDGRYDDGGRDDGRYDNGGYDDGRYDDGGRDDGRYDDGGYDDGRYDDGGHDDGRYDDGGHDDGRYDDGGHDDGRYDDGRNADNYDGDDDRMPPRPPPEDQCGNCKYDCEFVQGREPYECEDQCRPDCDGGYDDGGSNMPPRPPPEDQCGNCKYDCEFVQQKSPSECQGMCAPDCEGGDFPPPHDGGGQGDMCGPGKDCRSNPGECPCDLPEMPNCIGADQPGADGRGCAP